MPQAIPVTYYHSIGVHPHVRPKSFLSMAPTLFQQQVERLHQRGFRTIDLQQLYDYVSVKRPPESAEVVLTFDDGFLDNWTHVFPLAKKLGFKFTIFVNPQFVDPRDIVRPTMDDVADGKVSAESLQWWGFLSWPEMRLMEQSGLVDIQSHTMSHTWHFCGNTVVDYHRPGDNYPWLVWNRHPETMPFWMNEFDEQKVAYGTPVYEFDRSIRARRYFPDENLDRHLAEFVAGNGAASFFDRTDWRNTLDARREQFIADQGDQGRFETDDEHQQRVRWEIVDAKHVIEENLSKEVRFVCWPGGGETELARAIALRSGHLATTKGTTPNGPDGGDPTHIFRVAAWFDAPVPTWLKWVIFDGQFDRASNRRTARGALAGGLARAARLLRSLKS